MTLKEYQTFFRQHTGLSTIQSDVAFYAVIEFYFGLPKTSVALQGGLMISKKSSAILDNAILEIRSGKPLQYILGVTQFCGLDIRVTPDVLIPRPETEELVEWVKQSIPSYQADEILDIGTGSGCIAIAISKHFKKSRVTATDISKEAIIVARDNAHQYGLSIEFIRQDIFEEVSFCSKFDVVISNPPYVKHSDKKHMKINVLDYEPHAALFVDNATPLIFYERIANISKKILSKKGILFFEINELYGKEIKKLLKHMDYNVKIKKDLYGKDRFIKAKLL